jgi:hypothetical protein
LHLALEDGALFAQLGAPPSLAGFYVMFALAEFFLEATPFDKLLEAAQGRTNRFTVVDAHP